MWLAIDVDDFALFLAGAPLNTNFQSTFHDFVPSSSPPLPRVFIQILFLVALLCVNCIRLSVSYVATHYMVERIGQSPHR